MKAFLNKTENFTRIEFWAATTLLVFLVFFHISDAMSINPAPEGNTHGPRNPFHYDFVARLIKYFLLYGAFLLANFKIVPALLKKESLLLNIAFAILIVALIGLILGITNTYMRYQFTGSRMTQAMYNSTIQNSFLYACWLLLVFLFYTVIKYTGIYLLSNAQTLNARYRYITQGSITAFVLWMISLFLLIIGNAEREVAFVWAFVGPTGILLYSYWFYKLIPKAITKKRPFIFYLIRVVFMLALLFFPLWVVTMILVQDEEGAAGITLFNVMVQLLLTAPLSWVLFKRHQKGNEEIFALKTELGRSHASFDVLRSQINPHFLFNALNTIYGTAIQEGAERTSEGVEKLGDMMRFMLQENMQDKIPLSREVEYLNNYISLQKLRTDPNPIVRIEAEIEQPHQPVQIAPMLLIPFVENAFKHGISLREASYIKITLEVRANTLYFDVANTKHDKPEHDPEKFKSGIGLNNVKQRLQLLYPGKHELVIRETRKDFFVHLTLQLAS